MRGNTGPFGAVLLGVVVAAVLAVTLVALHPAERMNGPDSGREGGRPVVRTRIFPGPPGTFNVLITPFSSREEGLASGGDRAMAEEALRLRLLSFAEEFRLDMDAEFFLPEATILNRATAEALGARHGAGLVLWGDGGDRPLYVLVGTDDGPLSWGASGRAPGDTSALAWWIMGVDALARGYHEQALARMDKAAVLGGGGRFPALRAAAHLGLGDEARAAALLSEHLVANPGDIDAARGLDHVLELIFPDRPPRTLPLEAAGREVQGVDVFLENAFLGFEGAKRRFLEVLSMGLPEAEGHLALAQILEDTAGDGSGALKQYRLALEADRESFAARYAMAGLLERMSRYRQAARSYESALAVRPDFYAAHNLAVLLENRLGSPDLAVRYYRKALEIGGGEPEEVVRAGINLAGALERVGRFEEAAGRYQWVLSRRPENYEAGMALAMLHQNRLDDSEGARALLEAMAEFHPDRFEVHWNLALLLKDGFNESARARAHYLAATNLRPEMRSRAADEWFMAGRVERTTLLVTPTAPDRREEETFSRHPLAATP